MTLSVLMYTMMLATFVALAAVLVCDAVAGVKRWSASRAHPAPAPQAPARRRPVAGNPRVASTRS